MKSESVLSGMPVKPRRKRRTRAEMEEYRKRLLAIAAAAQPMSVRHAFYLAESEKLVEKTEAGYDNVGVNILHLRRTGRMPWAWITDGTRWRRKAKTHSSLETALEETANLYRRSLWDDQPDHVEIWTEKDSLTGVIWPVVSQWDVPLMVSKGFTSDTYLYEAAQDILGVNKPAYLYYLGDHDPSGVIIDKVIERKLRAFAPHAEIHVERIAVTPEQIELYGLPTRPTKKVAKNGKPNSHAANFDGDSVEVDAIAPGILRQIVRDRIEAHVNRQQLHGCRVAEASERDILKRLTIALRRGDIEVPEYEEDAG